MNSRYSYFGKSILLSLILLFFSNIIFAQSLSADDVIKAASKKSTVEDVLAYMKNNAASVSSDSEARELFLNIASIEEQLSHYNVAISYYNSALSRKSDKSTKSDEKIKLSIVNCALCCGETQIADSYLYELCNSKSSTISNYGKLYSQWSSLCKAESENDIKEPVELLKAYLNVDSMKQIHPVILLTLWYVTGSDLYATQLKKDFSSSPESAIVTGDIQLLPVPFWFFVPKMGIFEQGTGTYKEENAIKNTSEEKIENQSKFSHWQLGLFKSKENADILCKEVKSLGFDAFITSETRASGTTYYIVLVNDDKTGLTADKLRNAGYECYPVE